MRPHYFLLLELGETKEGKVPKIIFGRLEHDGVARFERHARGVVTVDFGQVRQHASLTVVGEIPRTGHELGQRDVGPIGALEAIRHFLLGG